MVSEKKRKSLKFLFAILYIMLLLLIILHVFISSFSNLGKSELLNLLLRKQAICQTNYQASYKRLCSNTGLFSALILFAHMCHPIYFRLISYLYWFPRSRDQYELKLAIIMSSFVFNFHFHFSSPTRESITTFRDSLFCLDEKKRKEKRGSGSWRRRKNPASTELSWPTVFVLDWKFLAFLFWIKNISR